MSPIKNLRQIILALSLVLGLAVGSAQGQAGTAVVTLEMPPPGGEGYSILQSGGMFADGATAIFYNPALLANLERHTGSQVHFSHSYQDLLPDLQLPDLYQDFWGLAAVVPDQKGGTDLGIGFFRNQLNFGEYVQTDAEGEVISRFQSGEDVYGLGIGIRLGIPVSLGLAAKYIDSRLASHLGDKVEAQSFAIDVGAVTQHAWITPSQWGLPCTEFTPSFSLAVKNLGPDVFYSDQDRADPIPRTFFFGVGAQVRMVDLFDFTAGYTENRVVTRRSNWSVDPVAVMGMSMAVALYRYSVGWLEDPAGAGDEKHIGHAAEMDLCRLVRLYRRFHLRDFTSPSTSFDKAYPFTSITLMGFPYLVNPRISFGTRKIKTAFSGAIRNQQEGYFISLSI